MQQTQIFLRTNDVEKLSYMDCVTKLQARLFDKK